MPYAYHPQDANPASEVGRVGQAINHMLNNVEEALAARQASETKVRQFVADASHELRNPLAAIRGYAELTRRDREKLPTEAAYAMSRVESEAERMSHLVEDMLLLARLDAGPDLDLKPCDLSEIVINAVSDARAAGPDHAWQLSSAALSGDRLRGPTPAAASDGQLARECAYAHAARNAGAYRGLGQRSGGGCHRDRQRTRHPSRGVAIASSSGSPEGTRAGCGRLTPGPVAAPVWGWPSWRQSSRRITAASRSTVSPVAPSSQFGFPWPS